MSSSELLVIGIAVLILFGGKRLPHLMRRAGRIIHHLRQHLEQFKREIGWNDFSNFRDNFKEDSRKIEE